jgi:hypothetical protein
VITTETRRTRKKGFVGVPFTIGILRVLRVSVVNTYEALEGVTSLAAPA